MGYLEKDEVRQTVQEVYGRIAEGKTESCCGTSSCCGGEETQDAVGRSREMGYSEAEVGGVPEGANLGLGCGNPQAIASLRSGETVLDLGSGGGFDCFLAGRAVGETGQVIGVDMTPEMVHLARGNAEKAGVKNVEFRLGEIAALPVADSSVDVIMSNCVINLSPEKERVFREAFRVLKSGGRLAISDMVATVQIPEDVKVDLVLHAGCVAGAASVEDVEEMLQKVGFVDGRVALKGSGEYVASANIEGVKP